jgi:hypothetical protein
MVYFDTQFLASQPYDALRTQMQQVLASDPAFRSKSDRQKQEMFESYAIAATWIDAGFNIVKRKGDLEGMRQWKRMARQNFVNMMGAAPEEVRFTSAGAQYQ